MPPRDGSCHPERSEGSAFPISRRIGGVRAWTAALMAVLGIAAGLVLYCNRPDEDGLRVARQAATQIIDAEHARTAAATAIADAKAGAQRAERDAVVAVSQAFAARARVRALSADDVVVVASPDATPVEVPVPAPVVERMRLDSSAVARLGTLVRCKDTVIVRQDQRITADSLELLATSSAFHALERVKEPRCGRRCGIVLGVGGMLAAAVAVEQVRRTFR